MLTYLPLYPTNFNTPAHLQLRCVPSYPVPISSTAFCITTPALPNSSLRIRNSIYPKPGLFAESPTITIIPFISSLKPATILSAICSARVSFMGVVFLSEARKSSTTTAGGSTYFSTGNSVAHTVAMRGTEMPCVRKHRRDRITVQVLPAGVGSDKGAYWWRSAAYIPCTSESARVS